MPRKDKYQPTMKLLTREQIAIELNTTKPVVDTLREMGAIPFIKVGHFVRFNLDEVRAALAKHTVKGA